MATITPEFAREIFESQKEGLEYLEEYDMEIDYLERVRKNWRNLATVPRGERTEEMYLVALKQDIEAFMFCPSDDFTGKIIDYVLSRDGNCISRLPWNWQSEDAILTAASNKFSSLCHVSAKSMTVDVFRKLQDMEKKHHMWAIAHIDKPSRAIALEAVKKHPDAIKFLSQETLNDEIINTALSQKGLALGWLVPSQRTRERCLLAVSNNGLALGQVPKEIMDDEIVRVALQQNPEAIKYAPEGFTPDGEASGN